MRQWQQRRFLAEPKCRRTCVLGTGSWRHICNHRLINLRGVRLPALRRKRAEKSGEIGRNWSHPALRCGARCGARKPSTAGKSAARADKHIVTLSKTGAIRGKSKVQQEDSSWYGKFSMARPALSPRTKQAVNPNKVLLFRLDADNTR